VVETQTGPGIRRFDLAGSARGHSTTGELLSRVRARSLPLPRARRCSPDRQRRLLRDERSVPREGDVLRGRAAGEQALMLGVMTDTVSRATRAASEPGDDCRADDDGRTQVSTSSIRSARAEARTPGDSSTRMPQDAFLEDRHREHENGTDNS